MTWLLEFMAGIFIYVFVLRPLVIVTYNKVIKRIKKK